jgi:hypothetical protein
VQEQLILPSEIPWESLHAKDFEECLYWLFDAMGTRDLEWRVGGTGDGAADGGRDLELTFAIPTPDGDVINERWWIEAKGRKKTVERRAVQESVLNCAGRGEVDVIVICTNSLFSNPTVDWVKQWQLSHARPRVRLWDRNRLEALFSKYPQAAIRLFPDALTAQGKLEVLRTRFWSKSAYAPRLNLEELWKVRATLNWSDEAHLAVLVSEIANGDILERPWHAAVSEDDQLNLLGLALLNVPMFCIRADWAGFEQFPFFKAIGLLISLAVRRTSAHEVSDFINSVWESTDGEYNEGVQKLLLDPVMDQMIREFRDVCTSDCQRVYTDPIELTENQIKSYWRRFTISPAEVGKNKRDSRILTLETGDKPCNVGFKCDRDVRCPLLALEDQQQRELDSLLVTVEGILKYRSPKLPN